VRWGAEERDARMLKIALAVLAYAMLGAPLLQAGLWR
jgi:hypothetical protein